jgi:hypothetical protein
MASPAGDYTLSTMTGQRVTLGCPRGFSPRALPALRRAGDAVSQHVQVGDPPDTPRRGVASGRARGAPNSSSTCERERRPIPRDRDERRFEGARRLEENHQVELSAKPGLRTLARRPRRCSQTPAARPRPNREVPTIVSLIVSTRSLRSGWSPRTVAPMSGSTPVMPLSNWACVGTRFASSRLTVRSRRRIAALGASYTYAAQIWMPGVGPAAGRVICHRRSRQLRESRADDGEQSCCSAACPRGAKHLPPCDWCL